MNNSAPGTLVEPAVGNPRVHTEEDQGLVLFSVVCDGETTQELDANAVVYGVS